MANVAHSTLTAANLHEPKGVAAATINQLYLSDGAGSGTWTDVSTVVGTTNREVGEIVSFGGTSAPSNWLLCDGSTVSRTTYSALYAVTGDAFGEGDGSTTFHVPDLRGTFLRGFDNTAGNDPDSASRTALNTGGNTGDNIGSEQSWAMEEHGHTGQSGNNFSMAATGSVLNSGTQNNFRAGTAATAGINTTAPTPTISADNISSNETRPRNVSVNFIIYAGA